MHRLPQKSSLAAQAATILREGIQAGTWDRCLPPEQELAAELRIARMTLRRALQQLEGEGLIRSSQGRRREIISRPSQARSAPSGRVLLLTPAPFHFQLPFYAFWINDLREILAEAGYHLDLHAGRGPYSRNGTIFLEQLIDRLRPVGTVITSSTKAMQQWFSRRRLPCVIVGSRHPGIKLPFVDKAHRAVCRHAVGLFLARGHTRLVLVNPDSGAAGDLESEQGFLEGVARSSRVDIKATILRHDGTTANICSQLSTLIRHPNPPTAFLVSRATHVLTVAGHLMRNGLRLGENVSVISRDHEPFVEAMVPKIAHYVVSAATMAHRISSTVRELVQSGSVSSADCQIMPRFCEGETLGERMAPQPG